MVKLKCSICNDGKDHNADQMSRHLTYVHNWHFDSNSKKYYDTFLKKENDGICKNCKAETHFYNIVHGYNEYCSECTEKNRITKIKETKLIKYGNANYNNRKKCKETVKINQSYEKAEIARKKTCLEKYGDENYNNRKKYKKTCLEKFGVECNLASQETLRKKEETYLKNWGVTNPNKNVLVKNKVIETNLKKYGVPYKFMLQYTASKISQELFNEIYVRLPEQYREICYFSSLNKEFGVKFGERYFLYDFVIKDTICIEYNGDNFHANPSVYLENDKPHPINRNATASEIWKYDKIKNEAIQNLGYKIMIVWDSDLNHNAFSLV